MDDCRHRAQLNKAPTWLLGLIAEWRDKLAICKQFYGKNYENPLREKFSHGNLTMREFVDAEIIKNVTKQARGSQ